MDSEPREEPIEDQHDVDQDEEEPVSSYSQQNSKNPEEFSQSEDDENSEEGENEMEESSQKSSDEADEPPRSSSTQDSQYYSSKHVFGLNLAREIKVQNLLNTHARLLSLADENALFVPELDQFFQNLKSTHYQPSQLPPMEGGIDYVEAEAVINKTNAQLYEELVYLLKVKQDMGASLHNCQDPNETGKRHASRAGRRRRSNFGSQMQGSQQIERSCEGTQQSGQKRGYSEREGSQE